MGNFTKTIVNHAFQACVLLNDRKEAMGAQHFDIDDFTESASEHEKEDDVQVLQRKEKIDKAPILNVIKY